MNTANYIEIRKKYIKAIQKGMQQYFWDNLFKELFAVLQDGAVYNAKSALSEAIKSGRIYYYLGAFRTRTKFSNAVASELEEMGARFKFKAYYINEASIPLEIQNVLAIMQVKGAAQMSAIERILTAFTAKTLIPLDDFIKSTVNLAFRQLETDILKEAIDKKVPVIELGLATPKAKGLEKAAKELDKWHNQREKEADKIRKQIEKEIEAHLTPKAKELRNQINEANKQQKVWKAQRLRAEYNKEVNANLTQKAKDLQEKLSQHNAETITQAPELLVKIEDLSVNYKSAKIAEDYIYNMNFWVKKWQTKNIIKMRSDIMDLYQKGARIPEIQEYIERRWKVAKDKAAFLAENECGLVTTAVQAATWQESGADEFIWERSVSREKRPLHKTYYGEKFRFDNPPVLDEKLDIKGLPRQIWNCLPFEEPIVSPFFYKRMYRRWHKGELTSLVTNTGYSLNTTPNHPILTDKGWVKAGSIKIGDKIVKVKGDFIFSTEKNPQNTIATIGELFNFFSVFCDIERVATTAGDFHGDITIDDQVDVINIDSNLFFNAKTIINEDIINLFFTKAEDTLIRFDFTKCSSFFKSLNVGGFIPQNVISIFDKLLTLIDRQFTHPDNAGFTTIANIYSLFLQMTNNSISCDFKTLCNSLNTPPFTIQTLYKFIWELFMTVANSFMSNKSMTSFSHGDRQITLKTADELGNFKQIHSLDVEFDTVINKTVCEFSNHVYNLENVNNWYLYHNYIIKNCKCGMKIVVPSIDKIMQAKKEQRNVYRKITNAFNGGQRNNSAWRYRRFTEGQTV